MQVYKTSSRSSRELKRKTKLYLIHVAHVALIEVKPVNMNLSITKRQVIMSLGT